MNRLELEKAIKAEGKKRGIKVLECRIYDRGESLEFYPEIENISADKWVYAHQVEDVVHDLAPLERPHGINKVTIGSRTFKVGETVEVDDIWIRLDAGEPDPRDFIKVGSGCGQYRQGWVTGTVFETPEQNDRMYGIKFNRDVFWENGDHVWIGDCANLERLIGEGKIGKVEKDQPFWCGGGWWGLRKK